MSNTVHCCIVFTNSRHRAQRKLEEIHNEKEKLNPNITRSVRVSRLDIRYIYEDEVWVWVRPTMGARGYRAHKAWIDENCTIEEICENILPICGFCNHEDRHFFR